MLFGRQASMGLVYEHLVDMRESFDGLHAIASQVTHEDAFSGILFLFVNRSNSIMKVLFWDRTGGGYVGFGSSPPTNPSSRRLMTSKPRFLSDGKEGVLSHSISGNLAPPATPSFGP